MTARIELLRHIGGCEVKYIHIRIHGRDISGTLDEVLPLLDFPDADFRKVDAGTIWYTDGTWSDREEYDGDEWWEHRVCPEIPDHN